MVLPLTKGVCIVVRRIQSRASQLPELHVSLHTHTQNTDKGFGKPQERRKTHPMCDPVDQTNFPLVKWANAVSGCVCVYLFETEWTTECVLKMY